MHLKAYNYLDFIITRGSIFLKKSLLAAGDEYLIALLLEISLLNEMEMICIWICFVGAERIYEIQLILPISFCNFHR